MNKSSFMTMRRAAGLLGWALGLTLWLGLHSAVQALQITDDRGTTVTLAQSPLRIVSLLPSLTEMVCALDQCQRLVGVDRYSNFPASVRALPQVGGGLDPNIEACLLYTSDAADE